MVLQGNGVSPGIVLGSIYIYANEQEIPKESFINPGEEDTHISRYEEIKTKALAELEQIRLNLEKHDPEKAGIFKAHQEIVKDIAINEEIPDKILNEHWSGDWAIYKVYETFLRMVKKARDPLIAERAADFEDVRRRLLKLWHGRIEAGLAGLTEPVIVAAKELLPSDTASLDKNKVLAIITETGGSTSHSAIIARSYGIPAVLGIHGLLETVQQGQFAGVNALYEKAGIVHLDPEPAMIQEYSEKIAAFQKEKQITETFQKREALTSDNIKIDIGLNIANADDKELAAAAYTDSVGLFRTEFLYMGRSTLPGEDEQFTVYKKVLERFGKRPVILRTLDIGGDKTLKSMELPKEENPFLGNRALRLCFTYPEIFTTQIRACLRASVYGNLWIMLPMVASLDDIYRAKDFIQKVREDLQKEDIPCGETKTGIMIEIPSIAIIAHRAAKEVDFASIGSNDLCQYLCAADRMNSMVEDYYQSYHPALFSLIHDTVKAFIDAGKPISICGEMGGDTLAAPALIGFGMRKLSMGAASVAAIKRTIAGFTIDTMQEIARKTLEFNTAEEIKQYLNDQYNSIFS